MPKLIPGVLCMGVSLLAYWLIALRVRGEHANLAVALAAAVFLYGVRLILVWLEERRQERKELPTRELLQAQPWLKHRPWRQREIMTVNPVGTGVLLLAYLFFGLPALFFVWLGIDSLSRSGEGLLLIPMLGLGSLLAFILGALTYWRLRHLRYGNSICRLITLPGVVGGWLKADVECALPADSDNTVVVRLKNLVPAGRSVSEVWRMEQRLSVPVQPGERSVVKVRLQIPRAPEQRLPPLKPGAWDWLGAVPIWTLELEKKVRGIDFLAQFRVPVYDVPDLPQPVPVQDRGDLLDTAGQVLAAGSVLAAVIGFLAIAHQAGSPANLYWPASQWMTGERFQREFNVWSRNGYYPSRIEGRCGTDGEKFRSEWKPIAPSARFWAWYAMNRRDYERKNREYTASGFSLESTTQYTDCSGIEKVQAIWLKR